MCFYIINEVSNIKLHSGDVCAYTWSGQQHKYPGERLLWRSAGAVNSDHRAAVEGGGAPLSPIQPQQAAPLAPSRSSPPPSLSQPQPWLSISIEPWIRDFWPKIKDRKSRGSYQIPPRRDNGLFTCGMLLPHF